VHAISINLADDFFYIQIADAKRLYEETGKMGSFNPIHCWLVLQNASKWQDLMVREKEKGERAGNQGDCEAAELAEGAVEERPIGWKAAKASQKRDKEGLEKAVGEMIKNQETVLELTKTKTATMEKMTNDAREAADESVMAKDISSMDEDQKEYYKYCRRQYL
jgi:hypothetical protein